MQASDHSPLEGESQKPSRQAKADAVGGTTSLGVRLGVVSVSQCVSGRRY